MFTARFMSAPARYFLPRPTTLMKGKTQCYTKGKVLVRHANWRCGGGLCPGRQLLHPHAQHIWITPAQEIIRQAPFLPFLPRPALQSLFCRRGSHGGVFHATTHFSQLLPLPGAPAFQDADLGVGCRVVGVTMFISHSGGSSPFPSFFPTVVY